MKQKKYFILAAAAILMAACSENDVAEKQSPQVTTESDAVDFDVYTSRGATRAVGQTGVITTDILKSGTAGFGVFGYYTNSERYSGITKPNFFYNQQVKYDAGDSRWEYTPVKYWPNEYGTDAISDQVDRVTFFAYAPYVDVDPLTGIVKEGSEDTDKPYATTNIISMTRNNVTGDPHIRYSASMNPAYCTDLLYGVAANNFTSSNSSVNPNNIAKGSPYKDVVKPGTDANSKIKFDFKHALAQLKVKIDANVVDMTTGSTNIQNTKTRIWVRSVTFEGITRDGSLNLNSVAPDPLWYDINGVNKITTGTLTVHDGLKDGREPLEKAPTEEPATFNQKLIQSEKYKFTGTGSAAEFDMASLPGVTSTPEPLFEGGETVFAIPTGEKMKVTIVYDVETYDPNLAFYLSDGETLGSTVENKISKTVETFGNIKAGYCYYLQLHLGMRTVDFDAEVTDWQNQGGDIDLPSNLQTFAGTLPSSGSYPQYPITLPWNFGQYEFYVSGLNVNQTPNKGETHANISSLDVTPVNSSGITKVTAHGTDNNTVDNKPGTISVNDGTHGVEIIVTQLAHPLGLSISSVGDKNITLAKEADGSTWAQAIPTVTSKDQIKVWRNGQILNGQASDATTTSQVYVNTTSSPEITLLNDFIPGDVIDVWIKAKDAAPESVKANIGGIVFNSPVTTVAVGNTVTNQVKKVGCTGTGTTITYEVSDGTTNVVTVDPDGKVTAVASGTKTIKATLAPGSDDGYYYTSKTKVATYTITVP
jgi:hypothetical protein